MSNPNRRHYDARIPVRLRPKDSHPGEFNKRAERHGNAQDTRRLTSTYQALATYRRGEPDDAEQLAQEQAAYRANFARARHAGHCVTPVIDTNTGDVAGQWCRECGTTI